MCNYIDVNEPVLELVRIENSAFNKNFKAIIIILVKLTENNKVTTTINVFIYQPIFVSI